MQLKLRLIAPLLLSTTATALFSAVQIWLSSHPITWFGAFLASAALPLYFAIFLATGGAARTAPRLPAVQIATMLGIVLAAYGASHEYQSRPLALLPLAAALLGFLVLQWYVFVFSRYRRKKSGFIVLGQPLPELVFESLDGTPVTLQDFAGSKTLLTFFRGNWCPLCMAQLRELRKRADRLAAASVQVKLISNQSVERSRELTNKLDLPDHFEILHDPDLRAAKALSIEDIGGTPGGMQGYPPDTVMATVIALDAGGRVIFGDETDNYRVRPHPDRFVPLFEDWNDQVDVNGQQAEGAAGARGATGDTAGNPGRPAG